MIIDMLLILAVLCLAYFLNKFITNWHRETLAAFRSEEESLHIRLASAVDQQKQALLELRNTKNAIVNYEQIIADSKVDCK